VEGLAGCTVSIASTGADRDHNMVLQKPFGCTGAGVPGMPGSA